MDWKESGGGGGLGLPEKEHWLPLTTPKGGG